MELKFRSQEKKPITTKAGLYDQFKTEFFVGAEFILNHHVSGLDYERKVIAVKGNEVVFITMAESTHILILPKRDRDYTLVMQDNRVIGITILNAAGNPLLTYKIAQKNLPIG